MFLLLTLQVKLAIANLLFSSFGFGVFYIFAGYVNELIVLLLLVALLTYEALLFFNVVKDDSMLLLFRFYNIYLEFVWLR